MSQEIIELKELHYKCREFLDKKDYEGLNEFLQKFTNEPVDINDLKMILVATQSKFVKENEHLKNVRNQIQELFDNKMKLMNDKTIKNDMNELTSFVLNVIIKYFYKK